jgi:hypothetical protein
MKLKTPSDDGVFNFMSPWSGRGRGNDSFLVAENSEQSER